MEIAYSRQVEIAHDVTAYVARNGATRYIWRGYLGTFEVRPNMGGQENDIVAPHVRRAVDRFERSKRGKTVAVPGTRVRGVVRGHVTLF